MGADARPCDKEIAMYTTIFSKMTVLAAAVTIGSFLAPTATRADVVLNNIVLNNIALNNIALNNIALNNIALNNIALNGAKPVGMSFATSGEDVVTWSVRALHLRDLILPDGRRLTMPAK
jgi:hypothetical protein